MQTDLKPFFALLLLLATLASCTEDNVPKPEESPFFTFFDEPNIAIDTTPVAATIWEYGFEFNPIVSGKITKLGVKLPTTGTFIVRLWRLYGNGAPTVITERVVTVNTAHEPTFTDINPVQISPFLWKWAILPLRRSWKPPTRPAWPCCRPRKTPPRWRPA